jgi:hypothetical protein
MYFSFIRPILEYGDVDWDTQTHYLINKIENVQSEAARIFTGGTKLTSIQKLYEETVSQSTSPYSKMGLIKEKYIFSRVNLFSLKRTFLNMFNRV